MDDEQARRRLWRSQWLGCIQEVSDIEAQRRLWLDRSNTNPHWSYIEYSCSYFDDLKLWQGYKWAQDQGLVTAEEASATSDFHSIFGDYKAADPYDPESILADPAWVKVTEAAS